MVVPEAARRKSPFGMTNDLDLRMLEQKESEGTVVPEFALQSNAALINSRAPRLKKPETIHVIVAVTDRGTPALTRYQRVVVYVEP